MAAYTHFNRTTIQFVIQIRTLLRGCAVDNYAGVIDVNQDRSRQTGIILGSLMDT